MKIKEIFKRTTKDFLIMILLALKFFGILVGSIIGSIILFTPFIIYFGTDNLLWFLLYIPMFWIIGFIANYINYSRGKMVVEE